MTSCQRAPSDNHQSVRRPTSWRRGILCFLQAVAFAAASLIAGGLEASAGGRLALVLAAEDYQVLPKSTIGAKRGSDIVDSLKALGFDVIVGMNPTNSTARASVAEFSRKAQDADLAIVVLAGHTTSANGQSFFLPVNIEIGAATDLLSRGISITNLVHLVGGAKAGAILVLMSVPVFSRPIEGIDARPNFTAEIGKSMVLAFSSSTKVPVSRVDALAGQNAEGLTKVFQKRGATLADAVAAVTAEGGIVFGTVPDRRLDVVPPPPPPPVVQATGSTGDAAQKAASVAAEQKAAAAAAEQKAAAAAAEQKAAAAAAEQKAAAAAAEQKAAAAAAEQKAAAVAAEQKAAAAAAEQKAAAAAAAEQKAAAAAAEQKAAAAAAEQRLREEQSARQVAEARAAEEKKRSSSIETELAMAQQQARAARLEAEKAKAEAEKMLAEAERAKAQAEADKARILVQAEKDRAKLATEQAEAEKKLASLQKASVPSAPIDEKELGQKQRLGIQERLKAMSLYTGPLDAVMGPLTREAIMGYQKTRGEAVTGYLTPEQFQALVPRQ